MLARLRFPSAGAVIGTGALVVALSGTAYAATTTVVTIQGGGSTNTAKVTASGQLLAVPAIPNNMVNAYLDNSTECNVEYRPPAGKALIITSIAFYNSPAAAGVGELDIYAGGCSLFLAAGFSSTAQSSNQTFPSGLVVYGGQGVSLYARGDNGNAQIYGYLVPASTVPMPAVRKTAPHARAAVRPGG